MHDLSSYTPAIAADEHERELAEETARGALPAYFDKWVSEFLAEILWITRIEAEPHHPAVDCGELLSPTEAEAELLAWLQARAAK